MFYDITCSMYSQMLVFLCLGQCFQPSTLQLSIMHNNLFSFTAEYFDNGHCHSCHSTCETCMGPTENDCLTCSNNLLLQNNKCVSTCDKGSFMEAGICTLCLHTCTQCVSRMNCTECVKGLQLQSGECRATCADG